MSKQWSPEHLAACERALGRANNVRLARAALRHQTRRSRASVASLVLDPPDCILTLPLYDLLLWQWRWAEKKARGLLSSCHISELRTVGDLTDRQRKLVAGRLGLSPELVEGIVRRADERMAA